MSVANTALLFNLAMAGFVVSDDLVAGGANSQGLANRVPGELNRCVKAAATGSFILPSIISGESPYLVFMVNDSLQTINIFPFVGESMIGVANAAFQVTAGLSGIFVPILNSKGGTTDWRAALIP